MKTYMIIFVILCAGCGNQWPAKIQSFNGFTELEEKQVLNTLDNLNGQAGTPIVDENSSGGYEIHFTYIGSWPNHPNRLGSALYGNDSCSIKLLGELFETSLYEYLEAVVWHELAHCKGIGHSSDPNALMYPYIVPLYLYTNEAINFFLNLMTNNI